MENKLPVINTWEEADARLARLCMLSAQRARIEAVLRVKITEAKVAAERQTEAIDAERAEIERDITEFARARRSDFTSSPQLDLDHGRIALQAAHTPGNAGAAPAFDELKIDLSLEKIAESAKW